MKTMNKRHSGARGEDLACAYLRGQGFEIIDRNYARAGGEIDIIAREGAVIAFIEVKARLTVRYGAPAEAVTPAKQKRILRTALLYASEHHLEDAPMRFDVLEVLPDEMNLIRAAFDGSDLY